MLQFKPVSVDKPSTLNGHNRGIEVVGANPMRLQTLDLARHSIITPEGTRVVVATMNDTHMGNGFVTAIYPQQNNLTLLRLVIREFHSQSAEQAIQRHTRLIQALQQGKLAEIRNGQFD